MCEWILNHPTSSNIFLKRKIFFQPFYLFKKNFLWENWGFYLKYDTKKKINLPLPPTGTCEASTLLSLQQEPLPPHQKGYLTNYLAQIYFNTQ